MSAQKLITVHDARTGKPSFQIDLTAGRAQMADGRLVTLDLGPDDVHIQQAMQDATMGFKLPDGIADSAMPVVPVKKASDKYWVWDKLDTFQQATSVNAAPGAGVPELPQRLSNTAYVTQAYAVAAFVPTEVEANADSQVQPRRAAVRRCMNALMMAREVRVATALKNASNYGSNNKVTIGATAKWDGGASSNPVQDLFTRIEASAMPITKILMSELVWHDFVQNAAVQKYNGYKASTPGIPNVGNNGSNGAASKIASDYAALLGLPPIVIGAMKTIDPTSGTLTYVWGNDVVLVHQPPSEGVALDGQDISTGYTFRWTGADGGPADMVGGGNGFFIREFFDPRRGPRGGTTIIVGHNDAEQFITDYVSGLVTSAHQ